MKWRGWGGERYWLQSGIISPQKHTLSISAVYLFIFLCCQHNNMLTLYMSTCDTRSTGSAKKYVSTFNAVRRLSERNKLVQAIMLLSSIWEVSKSILGRDTEHPKVFLWLSSTLPGECWDSITFSFCFRLSTTTIRIPFTSEFTGLNSTPMRYMFRLIKPSSGSTN
jgi:hypothetical protein